MTTDAEERILQLDRKVRANEHIRQVNEERRIHGEKWRRESFDERVHNAMNEIAEKIIEAPEMRAVVQDLAEQFIADMKDKFDAEVLELKEKDKSIDEAIEAEILDRKAMVEDEKNSRVLAERAINSNISNLTTLTNKLPVENGGTGRTSFTNRYILAGNQDGGIGQIENKAGAFYVPSDGDFARFDTLPVKAGGTGASTKEEAMSALGVKDYIVAKDEFSGIESADVGIRMVSGVWKKYASGLAVIDVYMSAVVEESHGWDKAYYSNVFNWSLPFKLTYWIDITAACHTNVCYVSNHAVLMDSNILKFVVVSSHALASDTYGCSFRIVGKWK